MTRYSEQIRDEYNRPVPGATVYVYDAVTEALETLTDDTALPLVNPVTTDEFGDFYFHVDDGYKLLEIHFGGDLRWKEQILVGLPGYEALAATIASLGVVAGLVIPAASRVLLAGLSTANAAAYLYEAGREGVFVWNSANLSAAVTADPGQGVYVAPTSAPTGASGAWVRIAPILTPEMFGAVGNGATDDYTALANLISLVNYLGGGHILFGKNKTYYIGRYYTAAAPVTDIAFTGCDGLTIDGNGSVISVKGDFDRALSTTSGMTGLWLHNCSNTTVRNLELDGNVELTTNSSGSVEAGRSTGLSVRTCTDLVLENVYSHHFATDGILIRESGALDGSAKRLICRRITARNCRFLFNKRQAMSISALRGGTFENCEFSWTGFIDTIGTTGGYSAHSPSAGVDIEPDATPTSGVDPWELLTGEIAFDRCRIEGNRGATFLAWKYVAGYYMDEISLTNCHLECNDGVTGGTEGFTFENPGGMVDNCTLNMRDKIAHFGFNAAGTATCTFRKIILTARSTASDVPGMYARPTASGNVYIEECDFIAQQTAPKATAAPWFFRIDNFNVTLRNNRFWLPKEGYTDATAADGHRAIYINAKIEEGNRYETDLLAASGGAGTAHFHTSITTNVESRNNRYRGVAAGWADTFRPGNHSTSLAHIWNTNRRFSSIEWMQKDTFDLASVAVGASSALRSVTVTGASLGDRVTIESPLAHAGVQLIGSVTAANTVQWYARNDVAGAAYDPASTDYTVLVEKLL